MDAFNHQRYQLWTHFDISHIVPPPCAPESFKHIFDIIAPPLTLAKKVPKPYQNGDYFIHIKAIVYLPIVAYISPISVANIVKIKVIFQLHELRKNLKICTPLPPHSKWSTFWTIDYFYFGGFNIPSLQVQDKNGGSEF